MAKFVLLRYSAGADVDNNPYIPDYATAGDTARHLAPTARYKIPVTAGTPLSRGAIDAINAATGADVYKIGDEVVNPAFANVPCSESTSGLSLRKLVFISNRGQSIGVPIADRTNLITARDSITAALNGANFPVVCVKLQGESHSQLNDIYNISVSGTGAPSPDPPTTGNGSYYSGQILYESDGNVGRLTAIKVLSDNPTGPPSPIAAAWTSCVGPFLNSLGCGGAGAYYHRRFTAEFLLANGSVRSREIPVRARAASDIFACGQAIADNLAGALLCLRYQGESYNLFHKIVAA